MKEKKGLLLPEDIYLKERRARLEELKVEYNDFLDKEQVESSLV